MPKFHVMTTLDIFEHNALACAYKYMIRGVMYICDIDIYMYAQARALCSFMSNDPGCPVHM